MTIVAETVNRSIKIKPKKVVKKIFETVKIFVFQNKA